MRTIGYLSQRGKDAFNFSGMRKCFTASAWMFLSYYNEEIKTDDIKGFNEYFDDVEASVGAGGTAEEVMSNHPDIKKEGSSTYFDVQRAAIQKRMPETVVFDAHFKIKNLPALVSRKPVIIRTYKMANLPGGHIILLVDYNSKMDAYSVNDPYGSAVLLYRNPCGQGVIYPDDFLNKVIDNGKGECIVIYAA